MKKTVLSVIAVSVILFTLLFAVASCGNDKTGRHDFAITMLSDFSADIDFLMDFDGNPISGTGKITKDDNLRFDVLSPDPYSGISIECDALGQADMISISYSGIKAEVPKTAMEKLLFVANMMSESTALAIKQQKGKDFKICEEMYSDVQPGYSAPYEVRFNYDNTDYIFIYDSINGMPLEIYGDNGYCKAEIKVRKLITEESASEE